MWARTDARIEAMTEASTESRTEARTEATHLCHSYWVQLELTLQLNKASFHPRAHTSSSVEGAGIKQDKAAGWRQGSQALATVCLALRHLFSKFQGSNRKNPYFYCFFSGLDSLWDTGFSSNALHTILISRRGQDQNAGVNIYPVGLLFAQQSFHWGPDKFWVSAFHSCFNSEEHQIRGLALYLRCFDFWNLKNRGITFGFPFVCSTLPFDFPDSLTNGILLA